MNYTARVPGFFLDLFLANDEFIYDSSTNSRIQLDEILAEA
jgi:hypothetical protein